MMLIVLNFIHFLHHINFDHCNFAGVGRVVGGCLGGVWGGWGMVKELKIQLNQLGYDRFACLS